MTSSSLNLDVSITCTSFNCKGFKQATSYIKELLDQCDVLCLSETWLRPGEIPGIKVWLDSVNKHNEADYDVYAKSSMEEVSDSYSGRPFGGMAIIVKNHELLNVKLIDCLGDRVLSVALYDQSGRCSQIICSVYMPYYDSSNPGNTESYIETIDILQEVIDKYGGKCPIKIVGDFKAQIPLRKPKYPTRYRGAGFNKHSMILYNFMEVNNLIAADISDVQSVKYTYFCHKRNVYTWLDHVLCFRYDHKCISECVILKQVADNDSDHLPVKTTFRLKLSQVGDCRSYDTVKQLSQCLPWNDQVFVNNYRELLAAKLVSVRSVQLSAKSDIDVAQKELDRFMSDICEAMHNSIAEAGNGKKKSFSPKPYWCPELSELRNKKRFWWGLWRNCGRPRSGEVYACYKGVKKLFRRKSRENINRMLQGNFNKFNELFYCGKIRAFWQHVKKSRKVSVNSALQADAFADFYENIMSDKGSLTKEQKSVSKTVNDTYSKLSKSGYADVTINSEAISLLIDKVNVNCAPGIDGIMGEHLKYGKCKVLCDVLSQLYSCILSWQIVPSIFKIGVIVPVLKKPCLNPNDPGSFRPVTLSSVFSKILEIIMLPEDSVCDSQFGFRKGRGTAMACSLLNDIKCYFENAKSPLYVCSLDAEKCSDSIWHDALLYMLKDKIPNTHWLILHRWYSGLQACIKWRHMYSRYFAVTKGTRQGSVLSPQLFNIFIDGLLQELHESNDKVRIGPCSLNSMNGVR